MTVTLAPPRRTAPQVVRLRPAPRLEPPFDDEPGPQAARHGSTGQGDAGDRGPGRSHGSTDKADQPGRTEQPAGERPPGRPGQPGGPGQQDGPERRSGGQLREGDGRPGGEGRLWSPGHGRSEGAGFVPARFAPPGAEHWQQDLDENAAADRGGAGDRVSAGPTDAEIASARFVRACSEVLGGFRPLRHLSVLIAAEYLAEASERLLRPRRQDTLGPGEPPGRTPAFPTRRPSPIRTATGPADAVQVRHHRISEPSDGVAEVSVVLARGSDVWAMAVRLERGPAGWLCTYLQVI